MSEANFNEITDFILYPINIVYSNILNQLYILIDCNARTVKSLYLSKKLPSLLEEFAK